VRGIDSLRTPTEFDLRIALRKPRLGALLKIFPDGPQVGFSVASVDHHLVIESIEMTTVR